MDKREAEKIVSELQNIRRGIDKFVKAAEEQNKILIEATRKLSEAKVQNFYYKEGVGDAADSHLEKPDSSPD